jgi:5-methylcytosine-specific restriction endonuclease McrA
MATSIKKQRTKAFVSQSGRCFYCGFQMCVSDNIAGFATKYSISLRLAAHFQCTGEHLQARQDGGSDAFENIVAACRFCNRTRHLRKNALDPEAFKQHVHTRLRLGAWHPPTARDAMGYSKFDTV